MNKDGLMPKRAQYGSAMASRQACASAAVSKSARTHPPKPAPTIRAPRQPALDAARPWTKSSSAPVTCVAVGGKHSGRGMVNTEKKRNEL